MVNKTQYYLYMALIRFVGIKLKGPAQKRYCCNLTKYSKTKIRMCLKIQILA